VENWKRCYRLLRPGGFLLCFALPRLAHRVTTAIEDAGFDIQEPFAWLNSKNVPWGSVDLSKAIDKRLGAERKITGYQPKAGKVSSGGSKRLGVPGGWKASVFSGERRDEPVTDDAKKWSGWRSRLKPGREDIIVAVKPLAEPTIDLNVLRHGVGGIYNVDASRLSSAERYPSTTVLSGDDGSPWMDQYFHVAKPVGAARHGHPTAKPVKLLRYLVKLVVPPGGVVLDPFAGAGSTGEACLHEELSFVGIEFDPVHAEAARARLAAIRKT
jgi:site-specific DNA-methyltransferase (adenine-specific)